ncbi:MAG: TetR/AcrR family transcriptional regulator [Acidimicrobiales bacterium]
MAARAEAMADVDRRVLDAAAQLVGERWLEEVTLHAVAERAGVTVPTVLRRYGSKDALLEAAGQARHERAVGQRIGVAVGDVAGAVRTVIDHYEEVGDSVIRLLAQEPRVPKLQPYMDAGRHEHESWVRRVFEPWLTGRPPAAADALATRLAAVTDVYVWKLLRRDRGLGRDATEQHVRGLVEALLEARP